MSENTSTQAKDLADLRVSLLELPLAELRTKAKKVFNISITREYTQDDIINLIMQEASKFDFAVEAAGDLKPGWARIRVHPVPGTKNAPIYVNINGKSFGIPVNIDCDVPHKVVALLKNAEEARPVLDDNLTVTGYSLELSYPFTLIELKPGPDPRPGMEVQREAKLKVKREFEKEHGYWPTDQIINQRRGLEFLRQNS